MHYWKICKSDTLDIGPASCGWCLGRFVYLINKFSATAAIWHKGSCVKKSRNFVIIIVTTLIISNDPNGALTFWSEVAVTWELCSCEENRICLLFRSWIIEKDLKPPLLELIWCRNTSWFREHKGNAHVNFSKPIAENVLGHNSAICEATDPIFWVVCPLGGYFWKT